MKRCPQCNRLEPNDALKFCRADGTTLVSDSGSVGLEVGTAKFVSGAMSSEIETSILPHTSTVRESARGTGPTTVLPLQPAPGTTRELIKQKRQRLLIALAILIVLAVPAAIIVSAVAYHRYARTRTSAIESIAVMPFTNTSGNDDVEYLSDGLTDTLIAKLSQLPNLTVKARSSVFHYKGKDTDAKTVGRELNVQAVLNGRVLQRGDELVLTLELVDTQTENVIWSEQYPRRQTDLVSLQSEIARDVSSKLRKLSGADEQKLARTYTTDPEAYQLYLKGIFYRSKRRPEDLKKGLEYFQQAIDRDPNYALAYVGVAGSYSLFANYGLVPTSEGYPRAKAAAQKALEIDPLLADAHATLADVAANYDWDWATAEREYKRAIELNPNGAGGHGGYGMSYLIPMRRFDEAVQELKRAQELEPLSLPINASLGGALTSARLYEEAITELQKTLELDDSFALTHWRLAGAYSAAGRHKEAIAEAKKAVEIAPNVAWSKWILGLVSARAGDRDSALKIIEELKPLPPNNTAFMIGTIYADLGDRDQAFAWLNKACENRDWLSTRIHVEPWIDNLGSDARLADLVQRMGLKP